ncbi:MAG: hypothetical protein XXXJIFNMEKO3_00094 [Candidatus Erwinia impunctatus]|nr:hypothetical protein XXXJIFNMEKO_00094 [Culicoides impunctatus]
MVQVVVKCPFCECIDAVKKHDLGKTGYLRYLCQSYCRTFLLNDAYRACQPGISEQIVDLANEQYRYS